VSLSLTVQIADALDDMPAAVRAHLLTCLREIAIAVESLPQDSMLRQSVAMSGLMMDIEGWRFQYRLDTNGRALVVDRAVFRGDEGRESKFSPVTR
jgi:hypothetical protein